MSTSSQYRSGIRALSSLAQKDIDVIFREVSNAALVREALADVLPGLIETYGMAAATLAADWYDDLREQKGVKKAFEAIPAEVGAGGADALAGYAISPLFGANPDASTARSLLAGGLQRRIADAGRLTIMESSLADPSASGWQRETDGNACAFCEMLAGRGSVYSEAGADFASHDACGCSAVPAFDGQPKLVKPYTPSSRNISDADRVRVREYLRTH